MPRIDELPEYRAKLPKNVHDLSHKLGFTATVAHLMPVFHDFLNPGETVELGVSYNLRTQPLGAAAMVDITSHVEYFFVPMQLLYEPFGSMYYNISDNYSSFINDGSGNPNIVQNQFPVLDFSDLSSEVNDNPSVVVGNEAWANHVYRLFDLLGYNNVRVTKGNGYNPNVFPYPILAYNCIYQYYYRLDNREQFNQLNFNWDRFYYVGLVTDTSARYRQWVRLFYRPLESTYFTDVKISPIVDVLNLNVKTSLDAANSWLTRNNIGGNHVLKDGTIGTTGGTNIDGSPTYYQNNPSNNIVTNFGFEADVASGTGKDSLNGMDINTANIRAMFATEKLWSITGRARKHYDDQTLAHFGFDVPHDVKHEISCFGHDRGRIAIGEVISTADTSASSGAALGEIAGKGYGSLNSKPHKFTAPCHGVVMAILSFVPDVTYGNTYLKANVMTNRQDLYTPEYDHLGMQPLFGYESRPSQGSSFASTIMGWQYRYEQWKRRYNRITMAFTQAGSLSSWMLDFTPTGAPNVPNISNFSEYLHNPSELNQIMLGGYVNTYDSSKNETVIYDGDPFVVDSYIHCKKVSTMSKYALPRLDA